MKRDGDHDADILALAREDRIRRHLHRCPQPGHAENRPLFDPGGDFDLDPAPAWQLHSAARAAIDLGEADRDGSLHINRPLGRLLARAPAGVAEDRAEDVAESAALAKEILHILGRDRPVLDPLPRIRAAAGPTRGARFGPGRLSRRPVLPELVVKPSLLGVREHLVGFGELLEARLGLPVARVQVGMVLAGELAEGGRDLLLRGRPRHAEHLVEVLGFRHPYLLPACGARRIPGAARTPGPRAPRDSKAR